MGIEPITHDSIINTFMCSQLSTAPHLINKAKFIPVSILNEIRLNYKIIQLVI